MESNSKRMGRAGRDAAECEHRERTHENGRERSLGLERTGGCRQMHL